jgi:asparagine synthase (glutamine-hydrolysing)
MAGIAGIANKNKSVLVNLMLDKISHRGSAGRNVREFESCTMGLVWQDSQHEAGRLFEHSRTAIDEVDSGHFAMAIVDGFLLKRDPIGVAPLYYGWTKNKEFCFASEVKGLMLVTTDIHELPPGHTFDGQKHEPYYRLAVQAPIDDPPKQIAVELRRRLELAVEKSIGDGNVGSWLSGGLDSSTMAALARPRVDRLHTFAAGLSGAPDLEYARQMADHIHSEHHEIIVTLDEILAIMPEVIYYLESFDALLVRSSILNYLVARLASQYVPAVLSGEGGDELFAGYHYFKGLKPEELPAELINFTSRLHNTALQRVDRCASAHGTVPHVCFLDPDVVDYALRIPVEYKLHGGVEKWILRQAVADLLPEKVLNRPKAKFWQGAGVENLLARYADEHLNMIEFQQEQRLPNGWLLNSKEELLYYRIFKKHFGTIENLDWMGRTQGVRVT